VDAQLLKTQNAVNDVKDQVVSAIERLNDLMGRDIYAQFRVTSIIGADDANSRYLVLPTAMTLS
jgi:hypothetical protein